jgi:hypothetical protein
MNTHAEETTEPQQESPSLPSASGYSNSERSVSAGDNSSDCSTDHSEDYSSADGESYASEDDTSSDDDGDDNDSYIDPHQESIGIFGLGRMTWADIEAQHTQHNANTLSWEFLLPQEQAFENSPLKAIRCIAGNSEHAQGVERTSTSGS